MMQCARYVLALVVTMGTYTLIDHFFMVDILNTNVILGVQWLIKLGKVTTDWETLEMEWMDKNTGRNDKIQGMHTYPPQTLLAHQMEVVFRKGDIEWAVELCVSEARSTWQAIHPDVKSILDMYATVWGDTTRTATRWGV